MSYKPVRFSRVIDIGLYEKEKIGKGGRAGNDLSNYYSPQDDDKKGYIANNTSKATEIYSKRYFAGVNSALPVAKINNRGVEFALAGNFIEAKFLFEEALKEDEKFAPACNNLGIISELFNRSDEAFKMYGRACVLEPDNEYYRNNFLYFQEFK